MVLQMSGSEPLEQKKLSLLVSPGVCHCLDHQALSDTHYFKSFASASEGGIKAEKSLWIFLQLHSASASPQLSSRLHFTGHCSHHPTPKSRWSKGLGERKGLRSWLPTCCPQLQQKGSEGKSSVPKGGRAITYPSSRKRRKTQRVGFRWMLSVWRMEKGAWKWGREKQKQMKTSDD